MANVDYSMTGMQIMKYNVVPLTVLLKYVNNGSIA